MIGPMPPAIKSDTNKHVSEPCTGNSNEQAVVPSQMGLSLSLSLYNFECCFWVNARRLDPSMQMHTCWETFACRRPPSFSREGAWALQWLEGWPLGRTWTSNNPGFSKSGDQRGCVLAWFHVEESNVVVKWCMWLLMLKRKRLRKQELGNSVEQPVGHFEVILFPGLELVVARNNLGAPSRGPFWRVYS